MHKTICFTRTALLLLLIGLGGVVGTLRAEVIDIDNDELRTLMATGIPVVDVRRPDEWSATGVIEQSELLTFFDEKGEYDADAWLANLDKVVAREEPVVLICRSGNRSSTISRWLSEKVGFDKVYNVTDGIQSWQAVGGRTVEP